MDSLVEQRRTRKHVMAHSIGRVNTKVGKGGGQFHRRRAREVLNPCVRESKAARIGRFLRRKLSLTLICFLPTRGAKGWDSRGVFEGYTGLWTTGCWLARRLR